MTEQSPSGARGWTRKAGAAMARLPDWIALTIESWRERRRFRHDLDVLESQGDLDRTLIDSGIAPSDVPRLLRAHPHTPEQLAAMMRRLGIDRSKLSGSVAAMEALRAMEWRCGECDDWRQCRAWLASSDVAGSYRTFCPNAEALDKLRCAEAAGAEGGAAGHCGILSELDAGNR